MSTPINKSVNIVEGLILLKIFIAFVPAIGYFAPPGLNLVLESIIYVSLISKIGINRFFKVLISLIPILLLQIVEYCITEGGFVYKSYMIFKYVLWAVIICWMFLYDKRLFARKVLVCLIISFIITAITTIIGNTLFPGASRFLAVGEYMAENPALLSMYMKYNIGDFVFVYTAVLCLPVLIYIWKERLINRFLTLVLIVLILFLSISTEYTTALVTTVLCYALFFFKKSFNESSIIKLAIIGVLVIVLGGNILPGILDNLAASIESESISSRLSDISAVLSGSELDENTSDLYSRTERNRISIETIKQNPILGSGGVWSSKGGHSLLLDYVALFGIFGVLMELVVFISSFKHCVKPARGSSLYGYLLFGFIIQLFLAAVNPQIFYHIILLVYPLMVFLITGKMANQSSYYK